MQPTIDDDTLAKFPTQIRGMVASMYSAKSICYNDLTVLGDAFAEESEPRYNSSAAVVAGVLGQMAIFEWVIAAGYRYHRADFIRVAEARAADLDVLITKISPTVRHIIPRFYPELPPVRVPLPAFECKTKQHSLRLDAYTPYYNVYSLDSECYDIDDTLTFSDGKSTVAMPSNAEIIRLAEQYKRAEEC